MKTYGIARVPWPANTPQHAWYGLGRYYAMFPAPFVTEAVDKFSAPGDVVMDPFSGRGNAPFIASAKGRPTISCDILPIAWLFTEVRLNPAVNVVSVLNRLDKVRRAVRPKDKVHESQFESMAWSSDVIGFLRAAKRELNWKESKFDRTLMAFIALHMQDKASDGLSNRLAGTVAQSHSYAIRWWTKHGYTHPPKTDPVEYLSRKIKRRYRFGVPTMAKSKNWLADSKEKLKSIHQSNVKLLITSPPYHDMVDYWNDQWIRMWLLGGDMRKDWSQCHRHSDKSEYKALINGVFTNAARHLRSDGAVVVRCGSKKITASVCKNAIQSAWPEWYIYENTTEIIRSGKASGHRHGEKVIREIDYIAVSSEMKDVARSWVRVG